MSRIYAITTKDAWLSMINQFHPRHGSHYINLPSGKILVLAHFLDGAGESAFSSHPDVELLPDFTFQGTKPLKPEHLEHVKHMNLEGNTVLHLAQAVAKLMPGMKLHAWL